MDRTSWIINVLDDSHNKSISYANRFWLRENVEKLHICVCVEDCVVNTFDIAKAWEEEGSRLIQDGKYIKFKDDFHPGKEALLIVKNKSLEFNSEDTYMVFLYYPKE